MSSLDRLHLALRRALSEASSDDCPPRLAAAMHHAVFPGGARLRPQLCLAIADACGDPAPELSVAAAAALELIHCASLVHDDMPCFDDAPTRRGRPSVHAAFGEAMALLVGDALIVHAFGVLGRAPHPRALAVSLRLATAAGAARGIVGGQAWELEHEIDLERYHRGKTGALFEAAAVCGALAAGDDDPRWARLGRALGLAYQCADDLADATGEPKFLGKPVGRDAALERPSAVRAFGVDAARARVRLHLDDALASIPERAEGLRAWLHTVLEPKMLAAAA